MQKTRWLKSLSFIVCMVLIAATALFTTGCTDNTTENGSSTPSSTVSRAEATVLGQGQTVFTFTVTDAAGKETSYEIHTDQQMVGEALAELDLIAGEKNAFGLYVKTVAGITVDYDKDRKYWAFYADGKYASAGVDLTPITAGATYSFKVE